MKKLKQKLEYLLKHNAFFNKLICGTLSLIIRILGIFIRTNKKAIMFTALNRGYNDSPKKIYEYLLENNMLNDYICYWGLDNPENTEIPGNCKKIKSDTLKYFLTSLKCKYWVACVNIERGLKYKKRKIIYLNTWHGTPLKTIGNAAAGRKDYNFSYINYFCSASNYEKEIYVRDFRVKESSIILSGLPRNDELYNVEEQDIIDIKTKLNIPLEKKVILYAPTWRDSTDKGKTYAIKPPMDLKYWKEKLSDEYVVLFRAHHYTTKLLDVTFDEFIMDCSKYNHINDLLKVADILISDYSATIFDYSILEKPIICFGYDYEEYSKSRGLYLDLNYELPSKVLHTEEEVIEKIININYQEECILTKKFKNKYLEYGGNATKECIEKLFTK